jgi:hypothetical protein
MRREAVRAEDDLHRGSDLDLARELLRLVVVNVADNLVVAATGAARSREQLAGDARRDVVEVGPAGLQELEPPLQAGRGQDLPLDR